MDTERRELLTAALTGYRQQRDQALERIAEIEKELRGASRGGPAPIQGKERKRHRISAEGRKRIAEAQRKRWAAHKTAA
jgi:hypothetical protein